MDIDQALAGIDKLLKSQELTFAFVGVAPALVIVYSFGTYLSQLWTGGRGRHRYGGKRKRASVMYAMRFASIVNHILSTLTSIMPDELNGCSLSIRDLETCPH